MVRPRVRPHGFYTNCLAGNQPVGEHDVYLERWDNDGSKEWQELVRHVKDGPVRDG